MSSKTCLICDEGTCSEQVSKTLVTHLGATREIPMLYWLCDKHGCETADARQVKFNATLMRCFKRSVEHGFGKS